MKLTALTIFLWVNWQVEQQRLGETFLAEEGFIDLAYEAKEVELEHRCIAL